MTVQCIRCVHFSLRDAGQMARQGYGRCAHEPSSAVFQSAVFRHSCGRFSPAEEHTVDARQAWLDGKRNDFSKGLLHDKT